MEGYWPPQFDPALHRRSNFIFGPIPELDKLVPENKEELVVFCESEEYADRKFKGWEKWSQEPVNLFRKSVMNQNRAWFMGDMAYFWGVVEGMVKGRRTGRRKLRIKRLRRGKLRRRTLRRGKLRKVKLGSLSGKEESKVGEERKR